MVIISAILKIKQLWQLKIDISMNRCLICPVLWSQNLSNLKKDIWIDPFQMFITFSILGCRNQWQFIKHTVPLLEDQNWLLLKDVSHMHSLMMSKLIRLIKYIRIDPVQMFNTFSIQGCWNQWQFIKHAVSLLEDQNWLLLKDVSNMHSFMMSKLIR